MSKPLPRAFYARNSLIVAQELLGMHLVIRHPQGLRIGRIVETEAYQGPEDLAAHSVGGRRTARTEVMFGPAGHAYVYLIYGIWNCLNVVTATAGVPHAVLLRALEPVTGIEGPSWGPGLLCRALGIDRRFNGCDLRSKSLWIQAPPRPPALRRGAAPRIGVDYAGEWAKLPWRFFDADSPFVSTVSAAARRRALAPP
ncbi:MAG: DNA-3-methyladenine glycosylase [Steroidobacteraceae bacterium]